MRFFTQCTIAAAVSVFAATGVYAQNAVSQVQRNINQQKRIEQGLESGALTAREAAQLQRGEARVEGMQARALSDGSLSEGEKLRIQRAQNAMSERIYAQKHDAQKANPDSYSSERMAADVARNVNQQERIKQGLQSGQLTTREAAGLQRGQAHVSRLEARAGANGFVGPHEQRRIQHAENRQSRRTYREKHDGQTRE